MNWRRFMPNMGPAPPHAAGLPHPQPSTEGLTGPWADLKCSDLRCWACPRELSRLIALDELRIVLAAIDAADLNQHRRLKVEPALMIVLGAIAVFPRRE